MCVIKLAVIGKRRGKSQYIGVCLFLLFIIGQIVHLEYPIGRPANMMPRIQLQAICRHGRNGKAERYPGQDDFVNFQSLQGFRVK